MEILASAEKEEKKQNVYILERKKQNSLFEDDMDVRAENSKSPTNYLLEVISDLNKGISYNVYTQ